MTDAAAPELAIVLPVYNEGEAVEPVLRAMAAGVTDPARARRRLRLRRRHDRPGRRPPGGRHPGAPRSPERPGSRRAQRDEGGDRRDERAVRPDLDGRRLRRARDRRRDGRLWRGPAPTSSQPAATCRGGRQLGGPPLKRLMSRTAGLTLHWFAGVPTHDPTNNFKLYSRRFLDATPIESTAGFELALELTVKATLDGRTVAEVPTTWRDRTAGQSNFKLRKWLPALSPLVRRRRSAGGFVGSVAAGPPSDFTEAARRPGPCLRARAEARRPWRRRRSAGRRRPPAGPGVACRSAATSRSSDARRRHEDQRPVAIDGRGKPVEGDADERSGALGALEEQRRARRRAAAGSRRPPGPGPCRRWRRATSRSRGVSVSPTTAPVRPAPRARRCRSGAGEVRIARVERRVVHELRPDEARSGRTGRRSRRGSRPSAPADLRLGRGRQPADRHDRDHEADPDERAEPGDRAGRPPRRPRRRTPGPGRAPGA